MFHGLGANAADQMLALFNRLYESSRLQFANVMAYRRSPYTQIANNIGKEAVMRSPLGEIQTALLQQVQEELEAILVRERAEDLAHLADIGRSHKMLIRQVSKCCNQKTTEADAASAIRRSSWPAMPTAGSRLLESTCPR